MSVPVLIAVDPGSAKCGVAVVGQDGSVRRRAVVGSVQLLGILQDLVAEFSPVALVVGDGTGSRSLFVDLENAGFSVPINRVNESHTSEAARARYIAENRPRGWQRLLPPSLRSPDRPYDDYVAVILAERWWNRQAPPEDRPERQKPPRV